MSLKNEKHSQEFTKVLQAAAKDKELLEKFLRDLLTPAEYKEVVARWQIVKDLKQGMSQHEIADQLKVGVATVSRGSRVLMNPTGGFNELLKKS